jgi:hypothetical protein
MTPIAANADNVVNRILKGGLPVIRRSRPAGSRVRSWQILSLAANLRQPSASTFRRYQYEEDGATPEAGPNEEGCPPDHSNSERIKGQDQGDRPSLWCRVAQDRK